MPPAEQLSRLPPSGRADHPRRAHPNNTAEQKQITRRADPPAAEHVRSQPQASVNLPLFGLLRPFFTTSPVVRLVEWTRTRGPVVKKIVLFSILLYSFFPFLSSNKICSKAVAVFLEKKS